MTTILTITLTLLVILLLFLIWAHKIDRSLIKTGKYVYRKGWFKLVIEVEN